MSESLEAKKLTALVADDEPHLRRFVTEYLKSVGFAVVEAEDGRDGLQKLNEGSFSLIVSDIMMPNLDGPSMLKQAHEQGLLASTKAILASADDFSLEGVREGDFPWKPDAFVRKPVTPISLEFALKDLGFDLS